MSLYSKRLVYAWRIAALDLPIPSLLLDKQDQGQWVRYAESLSPTRQRKKLAEALDQFCNLLEKSPDTLKESEDKQDEIYSKWMAAGVLASFIGKRLYFLSAKMVSRKGIFSGEMDRDLYFIVDDLKGCLSPEAKEWETRRRRLNKAMKQSNFGELFEKYYPKSGEIIPPGLEHASL